jgi:hypothetical protein
MFELKETATGYAKAAEKILSDDISFLEENPEVVPLFVSLLFQSLEISLKHFGINSGLFSSEESRDRKLTGNGHGIKEIASLANERLGSDNDFPVLMALTYDIEQQNVYEIIEKMIFGDEFEPTRDSYKKRSLAYAQLNLGEIQIVQNFKEWVLAVKNIAINLDKSTDISKQWLESDSESKHFAIWIKD